MNPIVTLDIGAAAKRQRSNLRTFTVTDTFSYLLTKLNTEVRGQRYCDGQLVGPNYIYPIAGRIGIDRMVHDFIELTLFASIKGAAGKGWFGWCTDHMADKLTFRTEIGGSVKPTVTFSPVSNAFQVANATLTAAANRLDAHQVLVALAISADNLAELDPVRSFLFSSDRDAARTAPGTAIRGRNRSAVLVGATSDGRRSPTRAEALAVMAVDQLPGVANSSSFLLHNPGIDPWRRKRRKQKEKKASKTGKPAATPRKTAVMVPISTPSCNSSRHSSRRGVTASLKNSAKKSGKFVTVDDDGVDFIKKFVARKKTFRSAMRATVLDPCRAIPSIVDMVRLGLSAGEWLAFGRVSQQAKGSKHVLRQLAGKPPPR